MSERWDFMCVGVMRRAPEKGPHHSTSSDVCLPCWEGFEINIMRTKHDRRHDFNMCLIFAMSSISIIQLGHSGSRTGLKQCRGE